jgi:hypothetical protein
MTEPVLGPSASGSVVLDLGPGTGAIVLHTPPELDGEEIEVSQDGPIPGDRTHSLVRRRMTAGGVQYAAVYPGIAAGDYTIWRDAKTPAMRVRVAEGTVTTAWWPAGPPG